jgi:hypothetical protein
MTPKRDYHPSWKIAVAVAGPMLVAIGVLGWLIAPSKEDAYLNAVFTITFSAVGWAGGMIVSPGSTIEEKKFTNLWKGISLFVSGYLVSKIDPLVAALLKPEIVLGAHDNVHTYRLFACPAVMIVTAILTYVIRVYTLTTSDA